MSEEVVKLVVLSPLLKMAGFYSPPFRMRTEAPVQIALEESKVLRGRIDVLVLQNRFWYWWWNRKKPDFPSRKQFLRLWHI